MITTGIGRRDNKEIKTVAVSKIQDSIEIPANLKEWPVVEELPEGTPSPTYTEEELYVMSHLINGEAGMSWASDAHQQLVGLVVMNRVNSPGPDFPDTIKEVVFQKGQYACTWDGNYDKEPSEQAIENAKKVLTGDVDVECPPNVVFQSNGIKGDGVFHQIYDELLGTTTYFCYVNY